MLAASETEIKAICGVRGPGTTGYPSRFAVLHRAAIYILDRCPCSSRECAEAASNMPWDLVQCDLQPSCLDPAGTFGMSSPSTILVSSLLASWETFISSLPFKSQHKVKSSQTLTTFPLSRKICIPELRDMSITRAEFRQRR